MLRGLPLYRLRVGWLHSTAIAAAAGGGLLSTADELSLVAAGGGSLGLLLEIHLSLPLVVDYCLLLVNHLSLVLVTGGKPCRTSIKPPARKTIAAVADLKYI